MMEGAVGNINSHVALHLHAGTKVILYGEKQLGFAPGTVQAGDQIFVIAG